MMLARNNLERELEKVKRIHREEKSILQTQIEELNKLSDVDNSKLAKYPLISPNITVTSDKSGLLDVKRSLEESNNIASDKLNEAEEKIFKLTTELHLVRSQHAREIQDLRLSDNNSEAHVRLQERLEREEKRCRELE